MAEPAAVPSSRPDRPVSGLGLGIIGAVVLIDQAAKAAAGAWLPAGRLVEILPILSLYRVDNQGIAFSLFSGSSGLLLILVTLAITVLVLAFWWRAEDGGRAAAIGYALIVGGALGNLADRLRFGRVTDFLLLHFGSWTLFVFNLADAALTAGPVLLLLVYFLPARPRR